MSAVALSTTRSSTQLVVFSYHKSGTSLFYHVMTRVAARLGLKLLNYYGMVNEIDPDPDIVLIAHSLFRRPPARPYRAIRSIRDPRDIWVSGYLYHLRCDELWCVNTELSAAAPIGWPSVDYSILHYPETEKRAWLARLNGVSYQQNLRGRSTEDGLLFELGGYTRNTLDAMRSWDPTGVATLDVRLEDAMADFDGTMRCIFNHFGFSADDVEAALEVARLEDVRRMSDERLAERPQITSRTISKWRDVLPPAYVAAFETEYGDLIRALGYDLAMPPDGSAIVGPVATATAAGDATT